MNLSGFPGLLQKEILRFQRVWFQTIAAPVCATFLYLLIFSHVLEKRLPLFEQVHYVEFLLPGLAMMAILQNAFSNGSSSLIQSKISGYLFAVLLTPITPLTFFLAYLIASTIRGLIVGACILAILPFIHDNVVIDAPLAVIFFGLMGSFMTGALGICAGLWAEKYDQLALFQNFIILPMTFLAGAFYSINSLPDLWRDVSKLNPFFYMIDGFRYGITGYSDISPWVSVAFVSLITAAVCYAAYHMVAVGYKIRD